MSAFTLTSTDVFKISDESGTVYYGGDQRWFPAKDFKKDAACGATTCANILNYFARTKADAARLCPFDSHTKNGFLDFMKDIYPFVKPGIIGIMPGDFTKGGENYAASRGFTLTHDLLTVPAAKGHRPTAETAARFISAALSDDLPVAFLNLSNGRVKNLDSYHWVTIVALDTASMMSRIVDNGRLLDVDIAKWLKRSTMGGAFVVAEL
ncbi:MAG: hypothetical protein LBQ21_05935 [Clostridiales Family XIII bacterium]|jgi:hypothetical protein|nr:hypothetical protein [Clostridiales Family XIII bacterium]